MTEPIANKIGVANLGTVYNQTNHITIQQGQEVSLIYSDPVPDLRFFQGRGAEQADLNGWLADAAVALVGVRGEGGIGKSTLMAKVFAESLGFAGKFWADVRTGSSMAAVAGRALQELGVPPTQVEKIEEKDLIPRLLRWLQQGRYLLAIDNLESVLTATGDWQSGYDQFLEGFQDLGSGSVLLLGSREYPPKYFGWRQSRWLTVEHGLEPTEGAALLAALEVEDTPEHRVAISVKVQGNPLALALLAGWLRQEYRPGERTIAQLQQTDLWQVEGRHRGESPVSVERVLQWSLDRLTLTLQHLITQVSVLRVAFNANVAAALMPEHPVNDADLDDLERRSLLQMLPESDQSGLRTFRLQPRIREFVQKRAVDLTTAHEKAIAFFWNHRQPQKNVLEDCREELEAFHHLCELGHYADAYQAMDTCFDFLDRAGYYSSLVPVYERLTQEWQAKDNSETQNLGWAWTRLGNKYKSLGGFQAAIAAHQQAQQHFQSIAYHQGEAAFLGNMGAVYQLLGQYQQAIAFHQQSLDIWRKIGDHRGEAASLNHLGSLYGLLGQYQQAIALQQQSLDIWRKIGDRRGESDSLGNLGIAYDLLGQYQQAIAFHQQSLEITREIGDRRGESNSLVNLGIAYNSLGQYQQAIAFYQQSLEITREIGDRRGESASLCNLGAAYTSLGRYQQAVALYQQSLEITREIGDRRGESDSLGNLGSVYDLLGQYQQAIAFQQQSLEITREIGNRRGESNSLANLGIAYNSLGQYQQAIAFYQQSLEITREIGDRRGEAASLFNLGHALARLDRQYEALQHYQQALVIYEALKLDHMVEECKTAIAKCNQIIPAERRLAPTLGEEKPKTDDWWEKSLPTPAKPPASRPVRQRSGWWQKWGLWFLVGLAIALLIWWLR